MTVYRERSISMTPCQLRIGTVPVSYTHLNHPRANLVLAEVLTEQGDTVAAAEKLAMHARFYGDVQRK